MLSISYQLTEQSSRFQSYAREQRIADVEMKTETGMSRQMATKDIDFDIEM